jgi:hypothetical protein
VANSIPHQSGPKSQQHFYLENYLTQSDWDTIENPTVAAANKAQQLLDEHTHTCRAVSLHSILET